MEKVTLCYQIPHPLFFAGRRRKEKLSKETPKGDAKRELFEKSSLLNFRKNFSAAAAGMSVKRTQSNAPAC